MALVLLNMSTPLLGDRDIGEVCWFFYLSGRELCWVVIFIVVTIVYVMILLL